MQHNADCKIWKMCRGLVKTHPGTNRCFRHLWKIRQHMGTALLLGTGFWMSIANSNRSEWREWQDSYFLGGRVLVVIIHRLYWCVSVCHNTQCIELYQSAKIHRMYWAISVCHNTQCIELYQSAIIHSVLSCISLPKYTDCIELYQSAKIHRLYWAISVCHNTQTVLRCISLP